MPIAFAFNFFEDHKKRNKKSAEGRNSREDTIRIELTVTSRCFNMKTVRPSYQSTGTVSNTLDRDTLVESSSELR